MTATEKLFPEKVCNCEGRMTQTVHENNAEGHQVGCPRWGITWKDRKPVSHDD